jgi:aminoglycoside/choline kinase family phosphotransferase
MERLIADAGFADARRAPLAGDASTRRYTRLIGPARSAMLMDAPPSAESPPCPPAATPAERLTLGWNAVSRLAASRVEAFVAIAQALAAYGLSAPAIYGADVEHGFAIVEDFGDALFARVIGAGEDEIALYEAAAEVLALVHRQEVPGELAAPGGRWPLLDYDALALKANADLFVEWIAKANPGVTIDDRARARWEAIVSDLVTQAMAYPRALTIRDYHAENLIWLPQRAGVKRVGLLDFQDAVRGWRAWDFAMLLQDARRDVSPAAAEAALKRYFALTGADEAAFREELALLGALNALRILGVFSRLIARDGKQRYAAFMPREWGHLAKALGHPSLGALKDFIAAVAGDPARRAA